MYSLVLSELHPVHSDSTSVKWEPVVLQRWNEGHLKKEEHKNVVNCLKKKKKTIPLPRVTIGILTTKRVQAHK